MSTHGGLDMSILMKQAADMSGLPTFAANAVLSKLSSPLYLDLGRSMSSVFRLWHLLNTLVQDSGMLKEFYRRILNGYQMETAPYSMYNIQTLVQFAAKLLDLEIAMVQGMYQQRDYCLSRQLRNAEHVVGIMEHESIGQKREQLHAQIDSLSDTLKLTISSSMREACENVIGNCILCILHHKSLYATKMTTKSLFHNVSAF